MPNKPPRSDSGADAIPLEGEQAAPGQVKVPPEQEVAPKILPSRPTRKVPSPEPRHEGELEVTWEAPEPEQAPSFIERHERALLFSAVLIGLLLRLVPILWGTVYYDSQQAVMHPDEPKLVRPLDDFPGSLATFHDYRYPTFLPFAYGALWAPVGEVLGLRDPEPSVPGSDSYEAAQVFGRGLNVLFFGLGGLLAIWAFTRRCFGVGPALLAVAAANTMGLPVTSTAMVSPDIPAAVLLFLMFYLLARAESRPVLTPKAMVGVGLALGTATAAKYTSGVGLLGVLLVVGYAWRRQHIDARGALRLACTAGLAALAAFLFFVPGVLYDTQNFVDSLAYEYRNKMQLSDSTFYYVKRSIVDNFSIWLLGLALLGLVASARLRREVSSRKSFTLPAAGLALAAYLLISLRSFRPDYAILFFPFVAMFAGVGLWKVLQLPNRALGLVAVGAFLLFGTLQSAHWCLLRYTGETRYRVSAWITKNIPPGPIGEAPSAARRSSGARAPEGYEFVSVHRFPEYIVMYKRRADQALDALADPEASRQLMATFWGEENADKFFSWEPGKRRLGMLKERDLRFYEDVMLGMRRRWKYDLVKEFEPVDAPLDLPGRWCAIYAREDVSGRYLQAKPAPSE